MEIFQNTLLQLVVRQGADSDRIVTYLKSGEPVYTTDTQRLFIGTGGLGGSAAGNKFQGSSPSVTDFTSSLVGDLAFGTDQNKLYRLKHQVPAALSSWELIGGVYQAFDNKITVDASNYIHFNSLSAGSIDPSALSLPIFLNGNNQISLSARIPVTELVPTAGLSSIKFPNALEIQGTVYKLPLTTPLSGQFLQFANNSGTLQSTFLHLSSISTNSIYVSGGLVSTANGVPSTGQKINPLSANIVINSNQIFARYNGLSSGGLIFNRGVTDATTLSAGHYRFLYDSTNTDSMIVNSEILGEDALGYNTRTISVNNSACHIKILNSAGASTNANISLLISYY